MPKGIYLREPWMQTQRKLTPILRERLAAWHKAGVPVMNLARGFNISPGTVRNELKRYAAQEEQGCAA